MSSDSDAIDLDRIKISHGVHAIPQTQTSSADHPGVSAVMEKKQIPSNADIIEIVARREVEVNAKVIDDESVEARIERLGRERPKRFRTLWAEIGFVFSISMAQVITVSFYSLVAA